MSELDLIINGLRSLKKRDIKVKYTTETYPGGRVILHIEYVEPDLAKIANPST